jgi:GTPase SAR1 family protein
MAAAAIVAAAGVTAARHFKSASGKEIAVLGPRKSGKSTLAEVLTSGTVTQQYFQTLATRRIRGDLRMESLSLMVVIHDPGGDRSEYGEWQRIYATASLICYVVDVSRLLTSDRKSRHSSDRKYRELAVRGAEHVNDWGAIKPTVLVLTHKDMADKDSVHPDRLFAQPDVRRIQTLVKAKHCVAVNLMDAEDQNRVRILAAQELRS